MKAGEIEYNEDKTIKSLVTIGDSPRDAVIRAEEFIREYFGDNNFVGNIKTTEPVGTTSKHTLYKVEGW